MSLLAPSYPPTDDVVLLQEAIAERLRAHPSFARVPVIVEDVGDIEKQIEIALGGLGVFALVMTPSMPVPHPNLPGPTFNGIRVVIRCSEIPMVNRGPGGNGLSAGFLAREAMRRLHLWNPPDDGRCLFAAKEGVQRSYEVPAEETAYDAHLGQGE